jgi:hypothetical protein
MRPNIARTIALPGFALAALLSPAWPAQAQDAKAHYPSMAPIDQYLMDRNAEIALARSAAPDSISRDADVLVLGRHGFEAAVKGKNGFVCFVSRSWDAPFESSEFWNPKVRAPLCYNAPGSRTIVPLLLERAKLVGAGLSKNQIAERINAPRDRNEVAPLEPNAICYMMSKEAYLTDADGHNMSHVMFYTPFVDGAVLGAGLPGSPVLIGHQPFPGAPVPVTEFFIPVGKWSDGTPASH